MRTVDLAFDAPVPRAEARWLFAALLLWGIGVQVNEAIASIGLIATALGVAALWARQPTTGWLRDVLRRWWPLGTFALWAIAAPSLAGRLPSGTGVARLVDWLLIPFAAFAVRALPARSRVTLAVTCGCVFLLSCSVAALQHLGIWPSPISFERLSWTRIPFYRVYEAVPEAEGQFMAGGLLFHRLKFAHVGGLLILAFLVLGLATRGKLRVFALGTAAIGFLSVLLFPYARAASVALVISASIAFALAEVSNRRAFAASAAVATVTLAALWAYPPTRERFIAGLTPFGSGDRGEILSTGIRAVAEHPIAGVGLGQFRPAYFGSPTTPPRVMENPGKAHNQFLSIAAETGIPGLFLFLLLLAWLGRSFGVGDPLGVFGISALVFFAILSLAHDPLIHAPFSMGLSLSFGVASARAPMSRR